MAGLAHPVAARRPRVVYLFVMPQIAHSCYTEGIQKAPRVLVTRQGNGRHRRRMCDMASIPIGTPGHKYIPDPPGLKYCKRCQQYVPVENFGRQKDKSDGLAYWCRPCSNAYYRITQQANQKKQSWKRHYGLTADDYQALFDRQSGVCAICGKAETKIVRGCLAKLSVDHDHETGQIRGLLCSKCNTGLGHFDDRRDLLERALAYLELHATETDSAL